MILYEWLPIYNLKVIIFLGVCEPKWFLSCPIPSFSLS